MKRPRDNEPNGDNAYRGESPFLTQFEIINGLTKKRAAAQVELRDAAFRRLWSTAEKGDASSSGHDPNLATLLEDLGGSAAVAACCTHGLRKLLDSITTSMSSVSYVSFIRTVQLVANDGHTLVMASPPPALDREASVHTSDRRQMFHQQAQSALQKLKFQKGLGEVFPGDTLLIQIVENSTPGAIGFIPSTDHGNVGTPESNTAAVNEDTDKDNGCSYGDHLVTNVEFLAFNTDVFLSVDAWRDAVRSNIAAICTWMAALSSYPPGLSQLSYIQACVLGRKNSEGFAQNAPELGIDGWARSLQLPLLLKVPDDLVTSLDRKTLDSLRRAILSALRLFVSIFMHASVIMPLPNLYQTLFATFVASPLFLEGFSTVLPDAAGSTGSLTWNALTAALKDAISLCMHHICHYTPAASSKDVSGSFPSENASFSSPSTPRVVSARLLAALDSFEILMYRLSVSWLLTNSAQPTRNANSHAHRFRKNQRVSEALEELATQGIIQGVAQWLQYKELNSSKALSRGAEGGNHSPLAGAHDLQLLLSPPALAQLEEARFASAKTAGEALEAMYSTYTPYLTRDALPFVEAAARAAYAELYVPALQATRTFLAPSPPLLQEANKNVVAVRVAAVRFPALQPQLSKHSWHDVRHQAEFGLPVFFELSPCGFLRSTELKDGKAEPQEGNPSIQDLRRVIERTTAANCSLHSSGGCSVEDGSCFANVVIRLQGRPVLFPVVITHLFADENDDRDVANAQVKAYVMRDIDMLAEFVETSAAMEAPSPPDAWLVTASNAYSEDAVDMEGVLGGRQLTSPPRRRLFPVGTPALAYMDVIKRLVSLRDELSSGMSYDALAIGKDKSVGWAAQHPHQPPNGATNDVSSLWLWYFATGELPKQQNAHSLLPANRAIIGDSGQAVVQEILQGLVESGPFTLAQVEALHALCSSAAGPTAGGSVLATIRVAEGCAGAGKTTVLYTSSAVRGEQMAVARREHQSSLQPVMKDATEGVKCAAADLRAAVSVIAPSADAEDQENPSSREFSPADAEKNDEEATLADALEGLVGAVELQGVAFDRLSRGLRYCSPSLLLRNGVTQEELPSSVTNRLHLSCAKDDPRLANEPNLPSAPLGDFQRCRMADVVAESHRRARHAPLAAVLSDTLQRLRRLGDALTSLQKEASREPNKASEEAAGELPPLHAGLLPLLLAGREVREVTAAAAADPLPSGSSAETRSLWALYLREKLWTATTGCAVTTGLPAVPKTNNDDDWVALRPRRNEGFEPVQMPPTMHLPLLTPDEAAGWWRVYAEKQVELIQHIRGHINASVQQVFRIFCDLVNGVAAVSQAMKQQVIVCSEKSILKNLQLPFLWAWSPSQVFIDDMDKLNDGMLLSLPSANSVTLSLPEKLPVYAERHQCHAAAVLLRSLRKELQHTTALSSTVLNDPLRCDKEVLQTVLAKLCTHDVRFPLAGAEKEDGVERGLNNTNGYEIDQEASENDLSEKQTRPCLSGLVSYSPLEVWTHSAPLFMSTEADAVAAAFVRCYLTQFNRNNRFHMFYPLKGALSGTHRPSAAHDAEDSARIDGAVDASYTRVCVPWFEDTPEEIESGQEQGADEVDVECEVGVICLSSLARGVVEGNPSTAASAVVGGSLHHSDARGSAAWEALLQGSDNIFHQHLCDWLWRVLSRVRYAAIIIGSKELFLRVPALQEIEGFVVRQRRVLGPRIPYLKYWLPSKVAGSVLALCCPEHYKCRRIASICVKETPVGESGPLTGEKGCHVKILGEEHCQSICLHSFDHCENRSHVCLLPCHLIGDPTSCSRPTMNEESEASTHKGNTDEEENHSLNSTAAQTSPHAVCPYPCCKILSCGHVCNRTCGSPCEPCNFVGLKELSCGQRVVSGINSTDMAIQYTFFAHFQEARCGTSPRRCEVPVSVSCPRCGHKSMLPCFRLTEYESQPSRTVEKHGRPEGESRSALQEDELFVLSRMQCTGCVALYNKVATKHGLDELPVPMPETLPEGAPSLSQGEGTDGAFQSTDKSQAKEILVSSPSDGQFPLHLFSVNARSDLERAFVLAKKKAELLLKKEALEISSGRLSTPGSKPSDYNLHKGQYNAQKAAQVQQEERWKALVEEQVQHWAQRLREEVEKQVNMNARMENMLPLLLSEAEAEMEKQHQSV